MILSFCQFAQKWIQMMMDQNQMPSIRISKSFPQSLDAPDMEEQKRNETYPALIEGTTVINECTKQTKSFVPPFIKCKKIPLTKEITTKISHLKIEIEMNVRKKSLKLFFHKIMFILVRFFELFAIMSPKFAS